MISQQNPSRTEIERYYNVQYGGRQGKNWTRWSWIPARDRYYARCLDLLSVVAGRRLLDIACGAGELLLLAQARGLECHGVDISTAAIEGAAIRAHASLQRLDVNDGLPYDDNFFDYVTCLGSLEHFHAQAFVLREMARVCRPSGRICLYVPNNRYILHRLGYETDDQPIVRRHPLDAWGLLIGSNDMRVIALAKSNLHLLNLRESSSYLKLIGKIGIYPLALLLPVRLSYSFWFVCEPVKVGARRARDDSILLKALLGNRLRRRCGGFAQLCSKPIWAIPCLPHSRDLWWLGLPMGGLLPIFAQSTCG